MNKRYYVQIKDGIIVTKGDIPKNNEYAFDKNNIEVSKEFYESLHLPAIVEVNEEGDIISVTPIPRPPEPPQPLTTEEALANLTLLLLEKGVI